MPQKRLKEGTIITFGDGSLKAKVIKIKEEGDLVFSKDGDRIWKCRNCGHIVIGKKAPEICPVCSHPKAYFEIKAENY